MDLSIPNSFKNLSKLKSRDHSPRIRDVDHKLAGNGGHFLTFKFKRCQEKPNEIQNSNKKQKFWKKAQIACQLSSRRCENSKLKYIRQGNLKFKEILQKCNEICSIRWLFGQRRQDFQSYIKSKHHSYSKNVMCLEKVSVKSILWQEKTKGFEINVDKIILWIVKVLRFFHFQCIR